MIVTVVQVVSVLLQGYAAFLALRLIPLTRHRRAWAFVAVAICLMTIRRGDVFYQWQPDTITHPAHIYEELIGLVSSILMIAGMAAIKPLFQSMKNSEEVVRKSERRYRNLYEAAPCGFLSIDREGCIRQCNRRAEQILGYAHGALLGIPMAGLLLDSNGQNRRPPVAHDHLWHGDPLTDVEVQLCTADARTVWVSLSVEPIVDAKDAVVEFRAIIVDITERVNATEQLRLTQYAVDHAGEAIVQVSDQGRFVYVNDAVCDMFGRSREDLLSMCVWDINPHMPEAGWPTHWAEVRDRGTLTMESEAVHADGTLFPVAVTINFLALADRSFMFTFVRDISERKRVQARLELTQFVVDHAGESIFLMDRDGRFTFVNDAVADQLGYSREEVLRMSVFDIDPVFSREAWERCWEELRAGKPLLVESVHRTKDGRVFPVEISANHVVLGEQEFDCAFVRDISERKRVAEQLQRQLTELQSIYNLSDAVTRAGALEPIYDEAISGLIQALGADRAAILLFDQDGVMRFKAWQGISDGYRRAVEGHLPWSPDATDHQPILIPDVDSETGLAALKPVIVAEGIHALAFIPLVCDRRLQGKFMLYYNQPHTFTDDELRLAKTIAGHVAIAIGRMRVEDALRESERCFREMLEKVSLVAVTLDLEGRISFCNDHLLHLTGWSQDELVGANWFDLLLPPNVREVVRQRFFASIRAGTIVPHYENEIQSRDGQLRLIHWTNTILRDPQGSVTGTASIGEDITERKQAEEAVRRSEAQLNEAQRLAHIGSWELDIGTDSLVWSDEIYRMFEIDPNQFGASYEKLLAAIHPEDREMVDKAYSDSLANKTPYDIVHRLLLPDGRVKYVQERCETHYDADGRPLRSIGTVQDITERKQTEEQIMILKHSLDVHRDGVYWMDSNSKFVYVNDAGCEALGYKPGELIGKSIFDVNPGASAEAMKMVWDMLRADGFSFGEAVHRRRDGSEFPAEIMTTYVRHEGKEFAAGFARDITERKRTEEQLLKAKRLEAAGQLAGQIAHDFNNLLGPLIAYPELIARHLGSDPRMCEMLHDMEEAAKQIAEINQELLTMSRRGHYNQEPVDLNSLFEHSLRTLPLPSRVEVRRELSGRLPLVRGGSSQVMRILANLITNAVDAMPDGGTLTLRTGPMRLQQPLERYPDVKPGDFVRLDIADTGRGVPAAVAEHIFEPFFTTKEADKKRGSGLGLTVVQSVMEDHNGYVDFESTPDVGTTFSLFFPVMLGAAAVPEPPADIPRGNGETVLVVDDDSLQLRIAERTLRQLGYIVHTVSSGEEAVAFLDDHRQDVVLLDMVMEGIDGTETLRRIQINNPDQIAIILSGFAGSDRVDEALRLGAKGFVQKPVQLAKLATVLHDALNGQRSAPPVPVA